MTMTTATATAQSTFPLHKARTMKAAVFHKFNGPIRVEDVKIPTLTDNDDGCGDCSGDWSSSKSSSSSSSSSIIVQVMATGVCRSDWHGWKGHDSDIIDHGLPFVPGHEFSGVVVDVGRQVKRFRKGDRVAVPFILSCGSCRYCCSPTSAITSSSNISSSTAVRQPPPTITKTNLQQQPTICSYQQQPGFTMWGSYAEFCKVPRADRNVQHLPSSVSFVQAAALGCRFTTAYRATLQQGQLLEGFHRRRLEFDSAFGKDSQSLSPPPPPFSVAVFGCGGLGLSCIMLAAESLQKADISKTTTSHYLQNRFPRYQIIAVDVSDEALLKAKSIGATHTVKVVPNRDTAQQVAKKVREMLKDDYSNNLGSGLIDGRQVVDKIIDGVDLTIDAAGFSDTSDAAVWSTRPGGRMVQVGLPSQPVPVNMTRIAGKEITIVGSHGFDGANDLPKLLDMVEDANKRSRRRRGLASVVTACKNTTISSEEEYYLDPCQLVEAEVTLEEGCQALQDMDKRSPLGIVMITSFDENARSNL